MEMKELKKLSNPDLVVWAISNGHLVRGLNRDEILELIEVSRQQPEVTIANRPPDEVNPAVPRIYNAPTIVKPESSEGVAKLSWNKLKSLAKEKGINTYGKKRNEIETLLKEQNNG